MLILYFCCNILLQNQLEAAQVYYLVLLDSRINFIVPKASCNQRCVSLGNLKKNLHLGLFQLLDTADTVFVMIPVFRTNNHIPPDRGFKASIMMTPAQGSLPCSFILIAPVFTLSQIRQSEILSLSQDPIMNHVCKYLLVYEVIHSDSFQVLECRHLWELLVCLSLLEKRKVVQGC